MPETESNYSLKPLGLFKQTNSVTHQTRHETTKSSRNPLWEGLEFCARAGSIWRINLDVVQVSKREKHWKKDIKDGFFGQNLPVISPYTPNDDRDWVDASKESVLDVPEVRDCPLVRLVVLLAELASGFGWASRDVSRLADL